MSDWTPLSPQDIDILLNNATDATNNDVTHVTNTRLRIVDNEVMVELYRVESNPSDRKVATATRTHRFVLPLALAKATGEILTDAVIQAEDADNNTDRVFQASDTDDEKVFPPDHSIWDDVDNALQEIWSASEDDIFIDFDDVQITQDMQDAQLARFRELYGDTES